MKTGEQMLRLTPPKGAVDVVVMVWWLGTQASGLDKKDMEGERYDERDLEPLTGEYAKLMDSYKYALGRIKELEQQIANRNYHTARCAACHEWMEDCRCHGFEKKEALYDDNCGNAEEKK